MLVRRTKIAIFKTILEWSTLISVAVSIYLAVGQPLFYILVAFCVLLFFIATHKSNYVFLKKDCLVYRKYWIWKKLRYDKIKVLFITKHSFMTKTSISDFYDKTTKQISGSIFLMKDISASAKKSLSNSVQMYGEWSITFIDINYKNDIIKSILFGGFDGDIYITNEMDKVLGNEFKGILKKVNFNLSNLNIV